MRPLGAVEEQTLAAAPYEESGWGPLGSRHRPRRAEENHVQVHVTSVSETDETGLDGAVGDPQHGHRVTRGRAALRRAAGVHDPDAAVPLELRHVRVPVHDHSAAGKGSAKTVFAPRAGTGVVDEPDP